MFSKEYRPVPREENTITQTHSQLSSEKGSWHNSRVVLGSLIFLASLFFNVLSYTRFSGALSFNDCATDFAKLRRDTPKAIAYRTSFNDPNRTQQNTAWASDLVDPKTLIVALEDSFTEPLGVLHSMRWPWDPKKGVYTLNSAHELHCLHLLRTTVNQAYEDIPLKWPRAHTEHCLEYLLQSVMCNADDTPLYQGLLHENLHADHTLGGLGAVRQCRNWTQLQEWAKARSACYDPNYKNGDHDVPELERYKFCPDGSRPWESE